uniref:Acyl-CoA dehydrogenase/oxidase C-terminal domain-containing protein n=1 Tax=Aotus nancymaae TaxID=37293 RepID=A0A2K5BUU9_AOTNA
LQNYVYMRNRKQWLEPLLQGDMTSCFCMTEPDVASSDATNIEYNGDSYVINAGIPKCKTAIVLRRTQNTSVSRHKKHSLILVPMNTPRVELIRPLSVFVYTDNFHGGHYTIHFNQLRVPATNLIQGEGRGFEISQGCLGPGRIHHCMRTIGLAECTLQIMCEQATQRVAFKKKLFAHEVVVHWIAESCIAIEKICLLTLKATHSIDTLGSIAVIKVAAPQAVYGGAGVSQDYPLPNMYALTQALHLADEPDEVHLSAIATMELQDQAKAKL